MVGIAHQVQHVKVYCHQDSNYGSPTCKTGILTTTPQQLTLHNISPSSQELSMAASYWPHCLPHADLQHPPAGLLSVPLRPHQLTNSQKQQSRNSLQKSAATFDALQLKFHKS